VRLISFSAKLNSYRSGISIAFSSTVCYSSIHKTFSEKAFQMPKDFRRQAVEIVQASLGEAQTQHPLDLAYLSEYDRPTMGGDIPIKLYRAVRLMAFRETLGSKVAGAILTVSGRSIGRRLQVGSVKELLGTLKEFGVGKMVVHDQKDDGVSLTAGECATCSGLPNLGETLCHFEGGIIAGGLEGVLGNSISVVETKCWGMGDGVCEWEAQASDDPDIESLNPMELIMMLAGDAASAMGNAVAIREKNRQLREANNRIRESERLKKDLTDMVVHDLRVPLTTVMGAIQTLADIQDDESQAQENELLNMALSSGNMMLQMINDLLDVSKLEERTLRLCKQPHSIHALTDEAVSQMQILARKKKQNVIVTIDRQLPLVYLDKERILRVLVNLLANALRHTPTGGRIALSATFEPLSNMVTVCVEDSGEGISKEYHSKIFDKFVQVEPQTGRRNMSTGLGLTFCKLVTEAHGGRIWVESKPGCGSKFSFTLPVTARSTP